jgi:hypothetical protein
MNREEFVKKWDEFSDVETTDVLSRVASNLSDLQEEILMGLATTNNKINSLKEYIFDYKKVIRNEKSKDYANV